MVSAIQTDSSLPVGYRVEPEGRDLHVYVRSIPNYEVKITLRNFNNEVSHPRGEKLSELIQAVQRAVEAEFPQIDSTHWGAFYSPEAGACVIQSPDAASLFERCAGDYERVKQEALAWKQAEEIPLAPQDVERLSTGEDRFADVEDALEEIYAQVAGDDENLELVPSAPPMEVEETPASAPALYREGLKNRELAKEAPQIFWPKQGALLKAKTRSEDEKFEAKPTPAKTDFSVTSGIKESRPRSPSFLERADACRVSWDRHPCFVALYGAFDYASTDLSNDPRFQGSFLSRIGWADLLHEDEKAYGREKTEGIELSIARAKRALEELLKNPESKEEDASKMREWLLAIAELARHKYGRRGQYLLDYVISRLDGCYNNPQSNILISKLKSSL